MKKLPGQGCLPKDLRIAAEKRALEAVAKINSNGIKYDYSIPKVTKPLFG